MITQLIRRKIKAPSATAVVKHIANNIVPIAAIGLTGKILYDLHKEKKVGRRSIGQKISAVMGKITVMAFTTFGLLYAYNSAM